MPCQARTTASWREEGGFTLPETLVVVAILGILVVIAILIWLGLLESRRVEAAANMLKADLRLAHASAGNRLTDWRVVLVPERGEEEEGPDYYLIKLNAVYEPESPKPAPYDDASTIPRTFPANVKVMTQVNGAGAPIQDVKSRKYYVPPSEALQEPTRTLELNSDGTMTGYESASGTVRVTIDDDPQRSVRYVSATSRVRVMP